MPTCFGLSACVSAQSPKCQACAQAQACASLALVDLELAPASEELRAERQRLSGLMQRFASAPRAGEQGQGRGTAAALELKLSPRVASQVRNLMEKGWFAFARQELLNGRNPAKKGWREVFCRLLLERRCSRHTLQFALMTELDLTEGSARAQASNAIATMAAGGLVVEINGSLRFTPN